MYYAHRCNNETTYQIIHYYNGGSRILQPDQHDYLAWIANGGSPIIEAAGRFLSVVDGALVIDPNKDTVLAAEEAARVEAEIKANLREIDSRSIRSLREYIAKKGDASEYLKTYEAKAGVERTKLVK